MRKTMVFTIVAAFFVTWGWMALHSGADDGLKYWPQWRGPLANGVAPQGNPPLEWSEEKNVKWKVECPGEGAASPIVWGGKVFILAAVKTDRQAEPSQEEETQSTAPPLQRPRQARPRREDGQSPRPGGERWRRRGFGPGGRGGMGRASKPTVYYKFEVRCLDRDTGKVLWQETACEKVPHAGHHADGSYASYSPVTDGEHLYADFGSAGIYCYDLDGNRKWERDLGTLDIVMQFGEGGSPALHGETLLVNRDHEGDSSFIALNKLTGETFWKVDRDEGTSWSTPLVVQHNGKTQVIVSASNRIRSYDIATGEVIWECGGLTRNVIPSPVSGFGMVFATSGFRGNTLKAITLGQTGDLTDTDAVKWGIHRGTPYVPSPLLYGQRIYVYSGNKAILSCYQARTGAEAFVQTRVEDLSGVYASPVGAAGRVYLVGRRGNTVVIEQSDDFRPLATNTLDDRFDASPAVVDDQLFLRGNKYLYCLAEN
jgi:outer membrane protein assembly factor BamB